MLLNSADPFLHILMFVDHYFKNKINLFFFHAVVEKGEIKWDDDDNWEVEQILDHVEEEVRFLQADTC